MGYNVEVADPVERESLFPKISNWQDSPLDHDLIAVAAPLSASNLILIELAQRQPAGLVFDIGSLKAPLRPGLEAMHAAGCKIASVHPMFGPDAMMLSGCHILLVETGNSVANKEARELFSHTAAECVELGIEDHDEVMSWVLGLSHLVNIAFAGALSRSHGQVPLLRGISSSTFDAQLKVAAQVVSDNPHLYYEIQAGILQRQHQGRCHEGDLDTSLGFSIRKRTKNLVAVLRNKEASHQGDRGQYIDNVLSYPKRRRQKFRRDS